MCQKIPKFLLAVIGALLISPSLWATTVMGYNLEAMADSADRIFRGTVLDVSEISVEAGGSTLPAIKYTMRVDEAFKGNYVTVKGERIAEIMMVGSMKQYMAGRAPIPGFPLLRVGGDYLLMVAPEGPVGLTSTMGLGQGAFTVFADPGTREVMALNGANNASLFKGMDVDMPESGPVAYDSLADQIRESLGN